MVLRTLEMQGFKSFPDKTVLNFGKGITAVVGPNGSGKSNISDAVRWVLGETSTKSLRGSKMEDVIFGGTSARKALGFAQVQLTLDNSDGTLKDRGEIVTVTRRYYRSGESEYKIDGEQVRRKDIRELFMDTGLGATAILWWVRARSIRLFLPRMRTVGNCLKRRRESLASATSAQTPSGGWSRHRRIWCACWIFWASWRAGSAP